MSARNVTRWSLAVVLIGGSVVHGQGWPPNRAPLPQGQEITARDGDRVIIEDDARVRIVRRRQGMVRTVFNPSQRLLILLIDYANLGEAPDGLVDMAYNYREVEGDWPLGERWEGFVGLEEYVPGSTYLSSVRAALFTPHGLIQLKAGPPDREPSDPSAIAVLSFRGSGGGIQSGLSFDQAEQREVVEARRNAERQRGVAQAGSGAGGMVLSSSSVSSSTSMASTGAVRVGSQVGMPVKIHDVRPTYPDVARQARVQGVVILELVVGADGSVIDARVVRSVPMLDAAALDAVRQWRYAPTLMNGQPVPVVLTVTVNFP